MCDRGTGAPRLVFQALKGHCGWSDISEALVTAVTLVAKVDLATTLASALQNIR